MISELVADVVTKLNGVAQLSGKVGAALGGKQADPSMMKVPLPASWVIFKGSRAADPHTAVNPSIQSLTGFVSAFVVIGYKDQDGLLDNEYPLLDECISAVRGSESPYYTRWRFENMDCVAINPDRLIYELVFSIDIHH